jgi:Zn-dependent peptidase ImmA (M78 family)
VERAGWSDEDVADREPAVRRWLAGERPTLKQLEKFANATHAPLGQLFLPEPPVEPMPIPDMRTMRNQEVRRPSADLLDTIYLCQARQDWYRDYAVLHGLSDADAVGTTTIENPYELVADRMRRALAFELTDRGRFTTWEDALRQLIDLIENTGVLVMVSDIVGSNTHRRLDPEEFRGFALADPLAPLVFVNGADTKAAQIFTLVHELAHIWLGGSAVSDAAMGRRSANNVELWCNRVAAEVLVPLGTIQTEYQGEPTVAELERLSKRYRVSTLVVLRRLFDARFLDWDDYRERYEAELDRVIEAMAARRGESAGGNYYFTQPLRLSRRFARAVITNTLEGGTEYRDAFRLLGTKKHETFQILASELGVA